MTNYYLKLTEFTDLNVSTEPHSDMTIHIEDGCLTVHICGAAYKCKTLFRGRPFKWKTFIEVIYYLELLEMRYHNRKNSDALAVRPEIVDEYGNKMTIPDFIKVLLEVNIMFDNDVDEKAADFCDSLNIPFSDSDFL